MSEEIQKCITNIYNVMELFNTSNEFTEIRYWLLNSNLGENENYLFVISEIDRQKKVIIKNLNQLSESVDDLEILINKSKSLVELERKKDRDFAKYYDRYYTKLNRATDESKM